MCVFQIIQNKLGHRDSLKFRESPTDPNAGEIFFRTSKKVSPEVINNKEYRYGVLNSVNNTVKQSFPEDPLFGDVAFFAEDAGGNPYIKVRTKPAQVDVINDIKRERDIIEIEKEYEEELKNQKNHEKVLELDKEAVPQQLSLFDNIEQEEKRLEEFKQEQINQEQRQLRLDFGFEYGAAIPVVEPVREDFNEVVLWKASQLGQTNKEIERIRIALKTRETSENRNLLKKLESRRNILEEQITFLNENREELSMQTVYEDLDNINSAIESDDIHDIEAVRDSLNFYEALLKDVITEDFRKGLAAKLGDIRSKYNRLLKDKIIKILEEADLVKRTLDELNNDVEAKKRLEKKEDELITVEDLLKATGDISGIDARVFGLISSRRGDTIIPQYLMYAYEKAANKWENEVFKFIDRLRAFNNQGGSTIERESLLEKDSNGVYTGNLINLTSRAWDAAQQHKNRLINDFVQSKYAKKKLHYIKTLNWFKKNSDAINFFKLKAVRDLYQDSYNEYFVYEDSVMDEYEAELKETLGPLYKETISNLLEKLNKFEKFKEEESSNPAFEDMLARQNIWEFLRKYLNADNSPITRNSDGFDIYFSYFNDFMVIPKKTIKTTKRDSLGRIFEEEKDSGFYNDDFQSIREDTQKRELWKLYKEMSEFINATYDFENFGRIKAPFIEKDFLETLSKSHSKKGLPSRLKEASLKSLRNLKSSFYEKGSESSEKGIVKNIPDNSAKMISELTKAKMLLGKTYEQANSEARAEIYNTYSKDLDKGFEASLLAASMHQARLELDPIASLALDYVKEYSKNRETSNARLELWTNKVIKNKSFTSKGKGGVGGLSITKWFESKEEEKKAKKNFLNQMQQLNGATTLEEFAKIVVPKKTWDLVSEQEKLILDTLRQFATEEMKPFQVSDTIGDETYFFEKDIVIDGNGNQVEVYFLEPAKEGENRISYSKEDFTRHLNEYIYEKVKNIGLTLTIGGISDAILTANLVVGLGLKPMIGMYQRWEGKTTNVIADAEGRYWSAGNLGKASEFMAFTNILKVSSRFTGGFVKKKEQMIIFEQLLERMSVLQQRTDDLQKDSEGFSKIFDMFAFSITLPEFKNQGEIALSILADLEIQDNNGNTFKFFDAENQEFPAYHLKDGVLTLKPEFSNLTGDIPAQNMENTVLKIRNAIKELQGNYSRTDIFGLKSHWLGRGFSSYFTWLPEFYNRRFGTTEVGKEVSVNLAQNRRKDKGRYIRGAEGSLSSTVLFGTAMGGIAYGLTGAFGAVPLSLFILYKIFRQIGSAKNIKTDVNSIRNLANFMEASALEMLSVGRFASAVPLVNKLRFSTKDTFTDKSFSSKIFGSSNYNSMKPEEIAALKSMAAEMAMMLQALSLKLAVAALMFDGDDDELSKSRLRYNFIQNQLSKYINSFNVLGTAPTLINGALENGTLRTISGLYDLLKNISNGQFDKVPEGLAKFVVPSDITNFLLKDMFPWENKHNMDEANPITNTFGNMSWINRLAKENDSGGEFSAKQEWLDMRKEQREKVRMDFRKYTNNKEVLKIIADNIIDENFLDKSELQRKLNQSISYKQMLILQDEQGKNTLRDRNKLIMKLKEDLRDKTNLTESEINNIVERRAEKY